jgi:hypothetical protein
MIEWYKNGNDTENRVHGTRMEFTRIACYGSPKLIQISILIIGLYTAMLLYLQHVILLRDTWRRRIESEKNFTYYLGKDCSIAVIVTRLKRLPTTMSVKQTCNSCTDVEGLWKSQQPNGRKKIYDQNNENLNWNLIHYKVVGP